MTTDDSNLREVDQELAEERQMRIIRTIGPVLGIIALAIVIGVAAWQFFSAQKNAAAEKGAIAYQAALFSLEDNEAVGEADLAAISKGDAPGYAALAVFRRAPLLVAQGDTAQAYALYRKIVGMDGITEPMRNLARLRSAYLSLDVGGRDAVISDLGSLTEQDTPLGFYALELLGFAAIEDKDFDSAINTFDLLEGRAGVPDVLRRRAKEFAIVARAGKSGANISGEARVEDLLKTFGETPISDNAEPDAGLSLPAIDDGHAGHDHDSDSPHDDHTADVDHDHEENEPSVPSAPTETEDTP